MFPCLEYLSVHAEVEVPVRGWDIDESRSLLAGLAMLKNLTEFILDLHYDGDVSESLGQNRVLNLVSLNKLIKLQLPLHFLVEIQPGTKAVVVDPMLTLPCSLKHLTVSSDTDFTKHLDPDEIGYASLPDYPHLDDEDEASPPYLPRHATIDFFEMVTGRVADHFCVLEEVTLRYGTNISSTMCRCNEVTPCDRCEAFEILNPYVDVDDSKCRMQELSSDLDAHGIRFHVVDPEVYVYAFDPPLQ